MDAHARWAALERAEARLAAGSYGRSVRSGRPIPDERLEADLLAELTVEEAAAGERGAVQETDGAVGLVSADHPFEVPADADITPEEELAGEEDDEPAPGPSPGIQVERDDRPGSPPEAGVQPCRAEPAVGTADRLGCLTGRALVSTCCQGSAGSRRPGAGAAARRRPTASGPCG